VQPILRWAGSKRKLLPKLLPFWGTGYDRYIEPFAGSAALFFSIQPRQAILNDINRDLIFALRQIRKSPRAVYLAAKRYSPDSENYYRLRATSPSSLDPIDRAARFVFLNRYCFNGLYRTNEAGVFNVPFAASGTGNLPAWEQFQASATLLGRASLRTDDFEEVIRRRVRRGDFVYLDPPYAVANRRVFKQYGPQTFGCDDLRRLSNLLKEIDRRGAHFLVSYAYCSEGLAALSDWRVRRVYTQRNIAGFARHRGRAAELLATNIENPPCASLSGSK
jgi:DNA adenine methylase